MNNFLSNLSSIYWWISVVVVGVLINILSVYVTRRLDARLSKASLWWRGRSEKERARYLTELAVLRTSQHEQVMAGLREIRFRIRSVFLFVNGTVFFAMGFLTKVLPHERFRGPAWLKTIVSLICMVLGAYAFFTSSRLLHQAIRQNRLIGESRLPNSQGAA